MVRMKNMKMSGKKENLKILYVLAFTSCDIVT
jgi:hypothetical protein